MKFSPFFAPHVQTITAHFHWDQLMEIVKATNIIIISSFKMNLLKLLTDVEKIIFKERNKTFKSNIINGCSELLFNDDMSAQHTHSRYIALIIYFAAHFPTYPPFRTNLNAI